ncbi:VOC family protein [Nonomuraea fuscirosea]|uniref:VOC family protein n=1 Tax=Nonomuraea fuscirosea TaxID=1291556 RepID=UPI00340A7EBF
MVPHRASPAIRKVDAVMVPVPDLDSGLRFYRDRLGHQLLWRDDELGQAGLGLPDTDTEMVLTTRPGLVPAWLVDSADDATAQVVRAGGRVVAEPVDVPVGRLAVVADPFGNELVLIDLSKGTYVTDASGAVTGVRNPAG